MFARVSRGAFLCLRCQRNLALQERKWLRVERSQPTFSTRRLQSSALARAFDKEGEEREADDTKYLGNLDLPKEDVQLSKSLHRRREKKKSKWRILRPGNVTELGVSALGKPAEVLVLPSRDRVIPEVPAGASQDHEQDIHETVEAERVELKPEQLKEHIESIRERLGKADGELSLEQWTLLKHTLERSFTANQLRLYIDQMKGPSAKPYSYDRKATWPKARLAKIIGREIWNLKSPVPSNPMSGEPVVELSKVNIKFSRSGLDFFLAQQLKQMAEEYRVKIEIYRSASTIRVTGAALSVAEVQTKFRQMQKSMKKGHIPLNKQQQQIFQPSDKTPSSRNSFLRILEARHGVHIEYSKKDNSLAVLYEKTQAHVLKALEHDIILASQDPKEMKMIQMWPHIQLRHSDLVPFFPPESLERPQEALSWVRCSRSVAFGADVYGTLQEEEKASWSKTFNAIRHFLDEGGLQYQESVNIGSKREEVTAVFGQVLFVNDFPTELSNLFDDKGSWRKSMFTAQIPVLAQFLASLEPFDVPKRDGGSTSLDRQFTYRLLLRAASPESKVPLIEIFLAGKDSTLGLNQPLRIRSVASILGEKSCSVLLPNQAVDIRFQKQTKQDMYLPNTTPDTELRELLDSLAAYLNKARGTDKPSFEPFLDLSLPERFRYPASSDVILGEDTTLSPQKKGRKPKPKTGAKNAATVQYVLAEAESADISAYHPDPSSHACLEHIYYSGDVGTCPRSTLRLVGQSSTGHQKKPKLDELFQNSYLVATLLSNPRLVREETE